jgi:hypothetical protein
MLLGALLGLGVPVDAVRAAISGTGLVGWRLDSASVTRAGLVATRAVVQTDEAGAPARGASELLRLVDRARPAPVAALAGAAMTALAETEAALHGVPVGSVHLHELGGIDTVVDLVGVAAALHELGVTEVRSAPLPMGSGTVSTEHGLLPVPAPATAALLARMSAPVVPAGVAGETVTPTGAALLLAAGCEFGAIPAMITSAVGYGAGGREVPGRPNVVQALLGAPLGADGPVESLIQLETNLDDVTGELLGYLVGRLLEAGASDAWVSAVTMKKGRPAHTVHVLAEPGRAFECERLLLRESGTLGVRRHRVERLALPRRTSTVLVDGQPIRIKMGPFGRKPEHDDVAAAAAALGLPLREVQRRASSLGDDLDLG